MSMTKLTLYSICRDHFTETEKYQEFYSVFWITFNLVYIIGRPSL